MKKSIMIASLSLLITLFGSSCSILNNNEQVVNIINVNDLHGALYSEDNHKSMAQLKLEIDAIENEDNIKNTLVIGNGDMFQGTALSNLSKGEAVINAMNACNFDIMGIGNHEFDWGIDEVLKYFDGDKSNGESTATLVNSNIYHDGKLLSNSVPYKVIDYGFVKVGVVSYAPYYLKKSILKSKVDGYDFRTIDTMNSVINDCKKEADIVVANTHWGEAAGDEVNVQLANLGVDAICDGHFHKEYDGMLRNPYGGAKIPVVQSRDQLKDSFGLIRLKIKNNEVIDSSVERIKIGRKTNYKEDPKVKEVVDNEYEQYKDIIDEPLALANGSHYKNDYRYWACDVIQKSLGVEVGVLNRGGIRNVTITSGDTIKYSDVFNIMPFDNEVYVFKLTGKDINSIYLRDAIFACRNDSNDPSYLEDGEPYEIAIIDFVALQNSQLEAMIKNHEAKPQKYLLRDMLANEIREHGRQNIPFNPNNEILIRK